MPRRPPALWEELVEKILLRLPPTSSGLFRAALVCKRWRRLISSPAFRRRYREFYNPPAIVAAFTNGVAADDPGGSRHESRIVHSKFSKYVVLRDLRALDARHGRVLLQWVEKEDARRGWAKVPPFDRIFFQRVGAALEGARGLIVWVPITKQRREVPIPSEGLRTLAAAVLCSDTTGACDHLDCQRGPFLVVLVVCRSANILIYTYSSETATWSDPISLQRYIAPARLVRSAYVGNALYFGFRSLPSILKYDLQLGQTSWIPLPSLCNYLQPNVFTTTEAGALGLATMRHSKINIWSRNDAPPEEDDAGWTRTKFIELGRWLPAEALLAFPEPHVLGSVDDTGVIFFWANGVVYAIDVKTLKWSKLFGARTVYTLICYRSFYTPALEAAYRDEAASDGGSSA